MNKKGLILLGTALFTVILLLGSNATAQQQANDVNANDVIVGVAVTAKNSTNEEYKNILNQLKDVEVKQDAIDKQENELKAQFRNGQLTREQYLAKLIELEKQEEELERLEDQLENKLDSLKQLKGIKEDKVVDEKAPVVDVNTTNSTIEQAIAKLTELDKQEEELDRLEDELEYKYRSGQLSRENFVAQMQELDKKERELDIAEDSWERKIDELRNANTSTATKAKTANIEAQEDELDRQEDELERKYRSGAISRQEFYRQKAQIEAKEEALDDLDDGNSNYGNTNYGDSNYGRTTVKKTTSGKNTDYGDSNYGRTTVKKTTAKKTTSKKNTDYGNSNYNKSDYGDSRYDD